MMIAIAQQLLTVQGVNLKNGSYLIFNKKD